MKLTFMVPGSPVPKARARKGKGNRWYTPEQTLKYEHAIGFAALSAKMKLARTMQAWPMDAKYRLDVAIVFKDERGRDSDNVIKSVADGCNAVLWNDDRQVKQGSWEVSVDVNNPRLEVTVEVL